MKKIIPILLLVTMTLTKTSPSIHLPKIEMSDEPLLEIELDDPIPDRNLSMGENLDDSVNSNYEDNEFTENADSDMDNKNAFTLDNSEGLDFGGEHKDHPVAKTSMLSHGANEGYEGFMSPIAGNGWPFHMNGGFVGMHGLGGGKMHEAAEKTEE